MTTATPPKRRRRWPLAVALGGAATAVGFLAACSSLDKTDLQMQLAALPKNASMGPLERTPLRADLGQGETDYELVHYRAGEPRADQLPVVLVHGTPSSLYSWSEFIHGKSPEVSDARPEWEGLAATHEVHAIEVIGHGVAPGAVEPTTFDACARYVVAAIRALGLERVHVVGTSYGGEFVWRAALLAPELVESITLLDASGKERRAGDWLSEEEAMRENPLADIGWLLNSEDRITAALEPHFETIPPDRVEEFHLVCENKTNWKAMIDLAQDENGAAFARLAELEARALLIWGGDDIAYPPDHYASAFDATIPRAELHVFDGVGHYPHEERTAEVLALMRAFIAKADA